MAHLLVEALRVGSEGLTNKIIPENWLSLGASDRIRWLDENKKEGINDAGAILLDQIEAKALLVEIGMGAALIAFKEQLSRGGCIDDLDGFIADLC